MIIIGFALLVGLGSSCGDDPRADWKTVKRSDYSISFPKKWPFNEQWKSGSVFILYTEAKGQSGSFRENISLVTQNLQGLPMKLDKYVEISEKQALTGFDETMVHISERRSDEQGEYHLFSYSGNQRGKDRRLKFIQLYRIVDAVVHVLTYTALEADFNKYSEDALAVMEGYEIKTSSKPQDLEE